MLFNGQRGDADLRLRCPTGVDGVKIWTQYDLGGNKAEITIDGLHTKTRYDFYLDVLGHGAITLSGDTNGGDFNPDYRLTISTKIDAPFDGDDEDAGDVPILAPHDPNDMLGPDGFGAERWTPASATLGYTVRFENDAQAGARRGRWSFPFRSTSTWIGGRSAWGTSALATSTCPCQRTRPSIRLGWI